MTEKIAQYVHKLSKAPDCNNDEFFRWADYIELKCLANPDLIFSKSEFIDVIRPRIEDLGEGELDREYKKLSKPEKNDKWEKLSDDIFRSLHSRISQYNAFYPFSLDDSNQALSRKTSLSIEQEYYLFLLFAANLAYTNAFRSELSGSFENVSLEVLKAIHSGETYEFSIFGSSNNESNPKPWRSEKIWDKLTWLADFLNVNLLHSEDYYNKNNKGDGGLDIVGKLKLYDSLKYFQIIFCQCACSPDDWSVKQHSIAFDAWNQKLHFHVKPTNYMFIPQSYRRADGEWFDDTKIHGSILFDRLRILQYFKKNDLFITYNSYNVLTELLQAKESIF